MSTIQWAIAVTGGVAAGTNAAIWNLIELCRMHGLAKPKLIKDGFDLLRKGAENPFVDLPEMILLRLEKLGGGWVGDQKPGLPEPHLVQTIADGLKRHGITHLMVVGGNDSVVNNKALSNLAPWLTIFVVPKSIDNDLCIPYGANSLGAMTAARKWAQTIIDQRNDDRSLNRFTLHFIMGRESGALTLMTYKAVNELLIELDLPHEFYGVEYLVTPEFVKGMHSVESFAAAMIGSRLALERKRNESWPFAQTALVSEGIGQCLPSNEIRGLGTDRDGNPKWEEIEPLFQNAVQGTLNLIGRPRVRVQITHMCRSVRGAIPTIYDIDLARVLTKYGFEQAMNGNTRFVVYRNDFTGMLGLIQFDEFNEKDGHGETRFVDPRLVEMVRSELCLLRPEHLTGEDLRVNPKSS